MSVFLHYAVSNQTELFRLSSVLDRIFGLILKIKPNACHHLKNLYKLGLKLESGLRTKSGLFYQVTHCSTVMLQCIAPYSQSHTDVLFSVSYFCLQNCNCTSTKY